MDNAWIFVIAAILSYIVWEKWRQWHLARDIPGPMPVPFFGNTLINMDVDQEKIIKKVIEVQKDFGSLFRLWIGPVLFIAIGDPENLEIVLKNNDNLNKAFVYKFFKDYISGVFSESDDKWKRLRKILNTMFHNSMMDTHVRTFNEKSRKLNDILMQFVGKGTLFDVKNSIDLCLLDIICKTSMGIDSDVQTKPNITFPHDVHKVTEATLYRMCKVWLYPDIIFYNTKSGREKKKIIKRVLDFVHNNILKPRRELLISGQRPLTEQEQNMKPYLDQMFEYAKEENISDYDLGRLINDVVIAGSDTTSVTVSYILLRLAMDQQLQTRVYNEIEEIFGSSDRFATMDDLSMMAQLEMIIKEAARISCPPHIGRMVDKEFKLGKVTIPKGSLLYLMIYKLHRNPKYWTHPDTFYPDHFLPENVEKRPKYAYIPFSYGQRICPGHKYSVYSMKVIVSTILRRYHLASDLKDEDLSYKVSFMVEVNNGYSIRITKRM